MSERLPTTRSCFTSLVRARFRPHSLRAAVAHLVLVSRILRSLLLITAVATSAIAQRIEPPQTRGTYHAAAYPTKSGVYRHKGWRYVYEVEAPGTRSERRIGRLFLEDREISGFAGEILEEYLGRFVYFGTSGYNRGWLNTLTYDRPVFEGDSITVTSTVKRLLPRENK